MAARQPTGVVARMALDARQEELDRAAAERHTAVGRQMTASHQAGGTRSAKNAREAATRQAEAERHMAAALAPSLQPGAPQEMVAQRRPAGIHQDAPACRLAAARQDAAAVARRDAAARQVAAAPRQPDAAPLHAAAASHCMGRPSGTAAGESTAAAAAAAHAAVRDVGEAPRSDHHPSRPQEEQDSRLDRGGGGLSNRAPPPSRAKQAGHPPCLICLWSTGDGFCAGHGKTEARREQSVDSGGRDGLQSTPGAELGLLRAFFVRRERPVSFIFTTGRTTFSS